MVTFEKTFYGTKVLEYGKLVGWVLSSINGTWTFTIGDYKHQTPLVSFEQAKLLAIDYILNKGNQPMQRVCNEPAEITIPNIVDAEVSAMMQAMYSRSNTRIKVRLDELDVDGEEKAKQALSSYYLGYGHASINDCGFTTIYIEGVSNVLAKAIEDTQLFNGQESSTRYLNYSAQSIIDPFNSDESKAIINGWLSLYLATQPKVVEGLMIRYPIGEGEDEGQYERAIKARSFDIMRGFLPVGVTTQLSWTTSLRHARDRIRFLKYHPCKEVREVIKAIHAALLEKYPHSFKATDIDVEPNEENAYYSNPALHYINHDETLFAELFDQVDFGCQIKENPGLPTLMNLIANRPAGCIVPAIANDMANFNFITLLDFGSYRDLQRHRRSHCPIPLVRDYNHGINRWYLNEVEESLSKDDFEAFVDEVNSLQEKIRFFKEDDDNNNIYEMQYLYPMGINIIVEFSCSLPQAIYVSELRSQPTVHETLRPFAQYIGRTVNKFYHDAPMCRFNEEPSAFNIARGKQTIFKDGKEIE